VTPAESVRKKMITITIMAIKKNPTKVTRKTISPERKRMSGRESVEREKVVCS